MGDCLLRESDPRLYWHQSPSRRHCGRHYIRARRRPGAPKLVPGQGRASVFKVFSQGKVGLQQRFVEQTAMRLWRWSGGAVLWRDQAGQFFYELHCIWQSLVLVFLRKSQRQLLDEYPAISMDGGRGSRGRFSVRTEDLDKTSTLRVSGSPCPRFVSPQRLMEESQEFLT